MTVVKCVLTGDNDVISEILLSQRGLLGGITSFHAAVIRLEIEPEGSYLVWEHQGDFVISVKHNNDIVHVKIRRQNGKFDVEGGEQFETLSELLEYYMKNTMVDTSDRSIHLIYFILDYCRKLVEVGGRTVLLDITHSSHAPWYWDDSYRSANVIVILYSVTNQTSFDHVRQNLGDLYSVKFRGPPLIVAGTNIHKRERSVTSNKGLKMAADIKAQGFFECSTLTMVGIDELFERAAEVGLQYIQNKGEEVDGESSGLHSLLHQTTSFSCNLFNDILKQGVEENYDIRVMLVGRAAVGKTTFTRRLLKLPVYLKKYISTNGVDVHIHSCDIQLDSGIWVVKEHEKGFRKKLMKLMRKLWGNRIKTHDDNAKKSNKIGYRGFHFRCAKVLQKVQESDDEGLNEEAFTKGTEEASDSPTTAVNGTATHSNGRSYDGRSDSSEEEDQKHEPVYDNLQPYRSYDGSSDSSEEEDQNYEPVCENLQPLQPYVLPKPTKSTGPIHKSIDNSDVEQTLEQAKTLPSQKTTPLAKVSLYDFAGQYIFHASHPTFLSPRAIYLLVFDLKKLIEWKGKKKMKKSSQEGEEYYFGDCRGHEALGDRESIFFWLNVIYLFAVLKQNMTPQVILVGTHYDKLPKATRDALTEKFFRDFRYEIAETPLKDLVSYDFVVDNSTKEDEKFSKIKSEIFRLAKRQPDWGKKTPSKWLSLEREIQCQKESGLKVISIEELTEINSGLDVRVDSEAEMEMFLQFLHDTGEIIYFSEKALRNHIVLNPVWLVDALKLVITSEEFAVRIPKLAEKWIYFYNTGVIYRSTIVGIFEETTDDPELYENHEHVIQLIEKFLFIASPVQFLEEESANGGAGERVTQSAEQSLNEDVDDEIGRGSVDDDALDSGVSDDKDFGAVGGVPLDPVGVDDADGDPLASIDNKYDEADTLEDREEDVDINIGPITQEHMNHARLCNVIVTVCADALRDILVAQVPAAYTDIYKALLGNRAVIYAIKQIGREQRQLIFPDPTFRYTGTVDQFDITLLYAMIRNISSCPAPATGWGNPPTDQPRDTSLSASVERIRLVRNKVSGHSVDGKLDDQVYEDYLGEISRILDDIEVVLGDQGYKEG